MAAKRKLARKCWLSEMMMQAYHNSLTPTFTTTYDALGDQETLVLKYTWDLSSYFNFFVFPFINDLTYNGDFIPAYLSRFSKMGPINHGVHSLISGYFQWKKSNNVTASEPLFHDFMSADTLQRAEKNFYRVGLTVDEGKEVLDMQLKNLRELACFIVADRRMSSTDSSRAGHKTGKNDAVEYTMAHVRGHYSFMRADITRIVDKENRLIGYEVRPLYTPLRFGLTDVLDINYDLQGETVYIYVYLKHEVEKDMYRDRSVK